MTAPTIIDATDRFAGAPGRLRRRMPAELPDGVIDALPRIASKEWTEEEVRAIYCPELKRLPFIVMAPGENNACKNAECYWNDAPTKSGHGDYQRGRHYARLTVEAIERDRPHKLDAYDAPRYLRRILEAIVNDAVTRRRKGGKGSRTAITSTMSGYLDELAAHICRTADNRPLPPPA